MCRTTQSDQGCCRVSSSMSKNHDFSMPEYVAGMQFDTVLLIDLNQGEFPRGRTRRQPFASWQRRCTWEPAAPSDGSRSMRLNSTAERHRLSPRRFSPRQLKPCLTARCPPCETRGPPVVVKNQALQARHFDADTPRGRKLAIEGPHLPPRKDSWESLNQTVDLRASVKPWKAPSSSSVDG